MIANTILINSKVKIHMFSFGFCSFMHSVRTRQLIKIITEYFRLFLTEGVRFNTRNRYRLCRKFLDHMLLRCIILYFSIDLRRSFQYNWLLTPIFIDKRTVSHVTLVHTFNRTSIFPNM